MLRLKIVPNLEYERPQNSFIALIVLEADNTKLSALKPMNEWKGTVKNGIRGVI